METADIGKIYLIYESKKVFENRLNQIQYTRKISGGVSICSFVLFLIYMYVYLLNENRLDTNFLIGYAYNLKCYNYITQISFGN